MLLVFCRTAKGSLSIPSITIQATYSLIHLSDFLFSTSKLFSRMEFANNATVLYDIAKIATTVFPMNSGCVVHAKKDIILI